jgi:chorismate lyase/3-hydroxybenzoate synthase
VAGDAAELLGRPGVLAVIGARLGLPRSDRDAGSWHPGAFDIGLEPLSDVVHPLRQVLVSDAPVERAVVGGLPVVMNGSHLFASVVMTPGVPTAEAAEAAYDSLLSTVTQLGYPHLVRAWNYLRGITDGDGDHECYRQFCVGRHSSFLRFGKTSPYPAASALGFRSGASRVGLLASQGPVTCVENPAQVSAFRYPRSYGPVSPSFSRAGLLSTRAGDVLFVSGTAAIIGHASMHEGDVAAQMLASLNNVEVVVRAAGLAEEDLLARDDDGGVALQLRIYVRRREDFEIARDAFQARVRRPCSVEWLQGDVCRRELLVEVEAVLCRSGTLCR